MASFFRVYTTPYRFGMVSVCMVAGYHLWIGKMFKFRSCDFIKIQLKEDIYIKETKYIENVLSIEY